MLGEGHFRVISYFIEEESSEASITTLASQLGVSQAQTSRIVSDLEAVGLAQSTHRSRKKMVALADVEPIEQFEGLATEYSHMDFPSLMGGAGLQILYYLDGERTATELAECCDVSRSTVYRRLEQFQQVGVVGKSTSNYCLNESFTVLAKIARGLYHQRHRHQAARHTSGLNFIWETLDEYLFACDSEIAADGFFETGPALFSEFGVPLLTRDRHHYFRSERLTTITPAELVCQTLMIDASSRYQTYCLLLMRTENIDPDQLRNRADRYHPDAMIDLRTIIEELIEYLETEGDTPAENLPDWDEFKQTATEYEIEI